MVGHLEPDPALCRQYAQFASHLEGGHLRPIYWTMFVTNLVVLSLASWTYTRGQKAMERFSPHSGKREKVLRTYILLCAVCVVCSTVIVITEAFMLLGLQFCDGEDLMSLYWSTWTMLQIGSLIAMFGIILALLHSLWDSKHPPWALALGTPVLVIAGVLHLFHECTKRRIKKIRSRSTTINTINTSSCPSMSKEDTIDTTATTADLEARCINNNYEKAQVELIGSTVDGGPILRFLGPLPKSVHQQGDILGRSDDDRPIVAYRRGVISVVAEQEVPMLSKERLAATTTTTPLGHSPQPSRDSRGRVGHSREPSRESRVRVREPSRGRGGDGGHSRELSGDGRLGVRQLSRESSAVNIHNMNNNNSMRPMSEERLGGISPKTGS